MPSSNDKWEDYKNNYSNDLGWRKRWEGQIEDKEKTKLDEFQKQYEYLRKALESQLMQNTRNDIQQEPDKEALGTLCYDPKKGELYLIPYGKGHKDRIVIKDMNDFMKVVTIKLLKK